MMVEEDVGDEVVDQLALLRAAVHHAAEPLPAERTSSGHRRFWRIEWLRLEVAALGVADEASDELDAAGRPRPPARPRRQPHRLA